MITRREKAAYLSLIAFFVLMLIGSGTALIAACLRLDPQPIAAIDQMTRLSALADGLMRLAILVGVIGGGVYLLGDRQARAVTALPLVWSAGVGIAGLALVIEWAGLLPEGAARGVGEMLGGGLSVLALIFWQIGRFSTLPAIWINTGVYSTGGLWAFAGALLTIQPLDTPLRVIGVVALPLIAAILASHVYLALANRNGSPFLSPHWVAGAVVLLLTGVGLFGAVCAVAQLHHAAFLIPVQRMAIQMAFAAALFGMLNQIGGELRGENRRITGLAPFWLILFGVLIVVIGNGSAAAVRLYLHAVTPIGDAAVETLLHPLHTLTLIGNWSMLIGVLWYGLGVWARRARFKLG